MNPTDDIAASPDPAREKKQQLEALLPEAFSEGRLDVAALKRALGEASVIDGGERYALNWAGKSAAYKVLQIPSTATLRPQRDLSVNFDTAQHVFIEGENLEVLKVLQKAYFGKVKLIYIDPPYNTGSDSFIYPDRFQESKEDYLRRINDLADDGTLMREGFFRKNSKESGHYHSNWLSMMLPRLYIARNLLRDDGVIFVSCDDHEVHNLRLLMNEVFGEENFLCQFCWKNEGNIDNQSRIKINHEYVVMFARNERTFTAPGVIDPNVPETSKLYRDYIENTVIKNGPGNPVSEITLPEGFPAAFDVGVIAPGQVEWPKFYSEAKVSDHKLAERMVISSGWSSKELLEEFISNGCKPVKDSKGQETTFFVNQQGTPYVRKRRTENQSHVLSVLEGMGTVQSSSSALSEIGIQFSYPKPVDLVRYLLKVGSAKDALVVDFFAGSGTLPEAVIRLNREEGANCRFIAVQLPEPIKEPTSQLNTVGELCRERIRRVLTKHDLADQPQGLKSFLLSPSNFKQWRGDRLETAETLAEQMKMFVDAEKAGAEVEWKLYELLLKFGQELTTSIETLDVAGRRVFAIRGRQMLFVLEQFGEDMIQALLALEPREIVALDSVFQNADPLKTNLDLQCRDAGVKFTCL
ncbi:MAG: site-specific DNA-methyltransferase [Sinimarinibacterium flocculans]|uniref:site-specific DNA-methyltransferase n=1 Tax=Sinimarinibacterium flocculans TaxID=985250 RepID=UPI003C643BA2